MPIGVASDNLINFSPVRSPRNRHAEKKEEEKIIYKVKKFGIILGKIPWKKIYLASKLYVPNIFLFTTKKYPECVW